MVICPLPRVKSCVDGLVELQQDLQCERGREELQLHQLVESLLEGVAEGGVAVQLVGHSLLLSTAKSKNQVEHGTALNLVVGSGLLVVHLVGKSRSQSQEP